MKIYKLESEQLLTINKDQCWTFFSDPKNLQKITPPDMNFNIISNLPDKMYAGQIVEYKIGLLPGLKTRWVTEITHVEEGKSFVDEQRFGPYKFWHHQHHFEVAENGMIIKDIVHYALPFWFIGRIANKLFINSKLKNIFEYRKQILIKMFGP